MNYIYEPENLYLKCLSYCGILLSSALLFYHMTKEKTLEMNKFASSSFAILLIIISISFLIIGTYSYYKRLTIFLIKSKNSHSVIKNEHFTLSERSFIKNEIIIFYFYLSLGIILLIVELAICYYIIIGCCIK